MSIEIASPAAKPVAPAKASTTKEAAAAKEKFNAPDKEKTGASAGFTAILASLGSAPAADPPDALINDGGVIASDATLDSTDAAALVAQTLHWSLAQGNPAADVRGAEADSSQLGGATGLKTGSVRKGVGALTLDAGFDVTPQKGNGVGLPSKGVKGQLDTAALQSFSGVGSAATVVDSKHAEGRDAKVLQTEMPTKMAASVVESLAPITLNLAKREEQNSTHGVFKSGSVHDAPGISSSAGWLGGAAAASTVPTSDPVAATPAYIAEQVSYWISTDVQKAELTLDGLGKKPVEVSITMHGNEAHVAFRTDEVQARDALENASAQLKEMLQRDGVVLSGMSVGTSAGGDAGTGGSQDRNARQGSRAVVAMVDQPARIDRAAAPNSAAGRALDLFV